MLFPSDLAKKIQLIVFDFDGVFTDNRVLVLQDGTEGVFCSRADGFGIEAVRNAGLEVFVLSKEQNPVVGARCKKLKLRCIQGCDNKDEVLIAEAARLEIPLTNVAYMGNDINDLECMKIVGFPVCVADSFTPVIALSKYITKTPGGHGAVREFCDLVAEVKRSKK